METLEFQFSKKRYMAFKDQGIYPSKEITSLVGCYHCKCKVGIRYEKTFVVYSINLYGRQAEEARTAVEGWVATL